METFPFAKLAEYGLGGLLAAFMFWFYRMDRKASEATITKLAEDFKNAMDSLVRSVEHLTEERIRREINQGK